MQPTSLDPLAALSAWGLGSASAIAIEGGHINRTWRVDSGRGRFLLQWLNPIFAPEVHLDIEAITARIEAAGLVTPRLVPTAAGGLWHVDAAGGVWRLFTFVEGATVLRADSAGRCREAGRLLGAFHAALWDFPHEFRFARLSVHDTAGHLAALEAALSAHADHPAFAEVEPLAAAILAAARRLDLGRDLPRRLVHGDPKISNFVFAPDGRALCLVDLDTLGRMPIAVELGDAFRSWCNPAGEEVEAAFRTDFFAAGLAGYAQALGDRPTAEECEAIPEHIEIIAVELAARFAADALNESYFNWDRKRFASAVAHNLVRARAQLALAESVRAARQDIARLSAAAWRGL